MKSLLRFLLLCSFIITGCEEKRDIRVEDNPLKKDTAGSKSIDSSELKDYKFSLKDFYSDNKNLEKNVNEIFINLTDDERIAQMIITSSGSLGKPEAYVRNLIKGKKAGGVLLLGGSRERFSEMIKLFKETADSVNSLPLIFSTDAEPSLLNKKISGLKRFSPTNTIRNEKESESVANEISEILKSIGFNQNYAPVCDFSYNKEIIGDRSFGKNESELINFAESFFKATQNSDIIATAKHFPGHGNVNGDSHKEIVYINGELKELNVFKKMIESGVISVMVGHIAITDNDKYNTDGFPSTLSKKIVTGLLKNEMGFKGLVITDAMNMDAVSKFQSPSLKAIEAGCDMVLMPSDEIKLINSVKEKMEKYPEFREQVYESVRKVIRVKVCLVK